VRSGFNVAAAEDTIDLARAPAFALGALKVNPPTLEVANGDRRDTLEPRIMQVLVALAFRRGEVVSREDLITQCWDGRSVGDDAINRCIGRLRRLAEAEGGFIIETIPRVGYRLKEVGAPDAIRVAAEPEPNPLPPKPAAKKRWWQNWWALSLAVLVIVAVTSANLWLSHPEPLDRVAVLPLQPLGGGDNARVFGTAVAEQIVGVLNENQVQAVAQSEIANLRGPGRDDAARKLGADFILDGTVQHTRQGLRVVVHLDRASSHATLWTATIEPAETSSDPAGLQSQVAARVVDVIKAALQAAVLRDDGAVAAFIKAKEYGREGGRTATSLRRDQMRIVVAHAPDFSLGRSGLAWSSAALIQFSPPTEITGLRSDAEREAKKALELDPHNGEAYLALAALAPPRDYAEQERQLRKGLEVQPDEPTLNSSLAALLQDVGRNAEALPLYERAALLDPLSPRKNAGYAAALLISGNIAQARQTIQHAAKLWPDNPSVWGAHVGIAVVDDPAEARKLLAEGPHIAPQLEPDFYAAAEAAIDAVAHKTPQSRAVARERLLAAVAQKHFDDKTTIELLTYFGDVDTAFAVADQSYRADRLAGRYSRPDMAVLLRSTTAALRRDPRFLPLAERLGLVTYWKNNTAPDFCKTEAVAPCPDLKRGGR
jgi:DNA-binding winged helix-turn-helix (wHTH) protein/TolB-like protein/Tfp pilus assembly protein PilF